MAVSGWKGREINASGLILTCAQDERMWNE